MFLFSNPTPGGALLPGEEGPKSCPSVRTDDLVLGAAVPLPVVRDPMVTQSPVEGIVGECDVVTEENITVHGGWSDPDVVGTPAVVAMVGMNALPIRNDAPFDCGDGDTAWIANNGYWCKIVDGMTVYYYGGNLCDSDESDWEDPYDIASPQYVDDYNFDVPEGMDLMVFERGRGPSGSEMLDEERTGHQAAIYFSHQAAIYFIFTHVHWFFHVSVLAGI